MANRILTRGIEIPGSGSGRLYQSVSNILTEIDTSGASDGWVVARDGSGLWEVRAPLSIPAGGTTGQVLTKQSGTDFDADWETAAGGGGGGSGAMVLLGTYTGSAVASIDALTRTESGQSGDLFQSDYPTYLVLPKHIAPASGVVIGWRVSTDGSTFISTNSYNWRGAYVYSGGTGTIGGDPVSAMFLRDTTGGQTVQTNTGWQGHFYVVDPTNTSFFTHLHGQIGSLDNSTGLVQIHWEGYYKATTAIKGIQLIPVSGNISGSFSVYGLAA
jgi:hypothetical protein